VDFFRGKLLGELIFYLIFPKFGRRCVVFPVFQSSKPKACLLSDDRIYENNHCDNVRTKSSIKRVISVGARKRCSTRRFPFRKLPDSFLPLGRCAVKSTLKTQKNGLMFVMMQNSIKKWWLSSIFQLLPQLLACDDLVYMFHTFCLKRILQEWLAA